ncbi:hypothetical protein [Defluviimonas sp. WL0075]|uniref:Uncharacterized protein n=1 Tax=Albidovulum sediminicola TaxID=2984331 RepID=A0ABT2Z1T6_9RHOB|nr:hypothetical protein [Defluviimonas sp. WL0075]MCV2865071.1 hypothetical protein [Defluviimonas sp. WL0075]
MTSVLIETADRPSTLYAPEVVGVFKSYEALQATYSDLRAVGFSRYDVDLLGRKDALAKTLGNRFWWSREVENDPTVPVSAFVPEAAMEDYKAFLKYGFAFMGSYIAMAMLVTPASTLAASISVVSIEGIPGDVMGAILAHRSGQHLKPFYEDKLHKGGIMMCVRATTAEKERRAVAIMAERSGQDVNIHRWID